MSRCTCDVSTALRDVLDFGARTESVEEGRTAQSQAELAKIIKDVQEAAPVASGSEASRAEHLD